MKVLSYINILSLDVVLGAVCCSLYLGQTWGREPSWYSLLLLACVVWLIYTFDHLKDVYKSPNLPETSRHRFHAGNFTGLIVASVLILVVAFILLVVVDEKVLRLGTGLLVLVFIYFLTLHFLPSHGKYHKEIIISILYTAGVIVPPLGVQENFPEVLFIQHYFQLMGVALGNLLCFSLYEYKSDREAGFPSLMEIIPGKWKKSLLIAFLLLQLLVCAIFYSLQEKPEIQIVFAIMVSVLMLITLYSNRIRNTDLFRFLGDSVFIIPLVFLEFR